MKPPREARRAVITTWEQYVCSRFDQAQAVLLATIREGEVVECNDIILGPTTPEKLCQFILGEDADTLVTGGIQRRYFEYLTWKKVDVLDSVMGPWETALKLLTKGELRPGSVLYTPEENSC
ncbi:NifB/NifX family molybdenum-iron cluster-binding protein [Desulfohalovibrio reitneri]|uniref:NifB/NifX family molybdenum-iron cluster-binding protein n=1 Tax=Desulfohalovibrio reitneri TaxID=1307759 RepID=UPI0004A6EBE0|nr:NifB/NifX family molybdenum-iron cluster-binding protein [Desulfohalovibrio reitneri]